MSKKIYIAKKIITMNPSQPTATHIAVNGDKIMGVGPAEGMVGFEDYTIDDCFSDNIILPGFIEGHAHAVSGSVWDNMYLGRFGRTDPDGKYWPDLANLDDVAERLAEAHKQYPAGEAMICWGFDPIHFPGKRIDKDFLDAIVPDRPLAVVHMNMHLMTINSALLDLAGITKDNRTEGVLLNNDGEPNGELQEIAAMGLAFAALETDLFKGYDDPETYLKYSKLAARAGITTITDLFNSLEPDVIKAMEQASTDDRFAIRLLPAFAVMGIDPADGIAKIKTCQENSTERLIYGLAKIMTDGSIQGFTGRLKEPGYHNGAPPGIWNVPPEILHQTVLAYHQAGIHLHMHANGDEAIEVMLRAIHEGLTLWPNLDHRHTLQHVQLIDQGQLRRAKHLGVCLNMFANHLYYWGDIHREQTMGYERSLRLSAMGSAMRHNIVTAIHSDSPITPLGPLFSVQCAVTRRTAKGVELGDAEKVTVQQALEMLTINSAYTLRMEHLVGSLEGGKYADMVILDDDPLNCNVNKISDIKVLATVSGGRIYEQ